MGGFFRLDSPFMNFLGKVADLMILNVITIVCCIPVFTSGAALTAMFSVLLKMVRKEEPSIVKSYFKSFKENFKQSTILWLIMFVIIGFLAFDYYMFLHDPTGNAFPQAVRIMVIAVTVIAAAFMIYIFPLQSRFANPVNKTIRNAFFVAFGNLPITIAILVIYVVFALIYASFYQITPVVILMGLTIPNYFACMLINTIFKKFEPKTEEATDEYVPLSIFEESAEQTESVDVTVEENGTEE